MYCLNCGKILPEEAKFCPHCGARVRPEVPEEQTSAPEVPETPAPETPAPKAGKKRRASAGKKAPREKLPLRRRLQKLPLPIKILLGLLAAALLMAALLGIDYIQQRQPLDCPDPEAFFSLENQFYHSFNKRGYSSPLDDYDTALAAVRAYRELLEGTYHAETSFKTDSDTDYVSLQLTVSKKTLFHEVHHELTIEYQAGVWCLNNPWSWSDLNFVHVEPWSPGDTVIQGGAEPSKEPTPADEPTPSNEATASNEPTPSNEPAPSNEPTASNEPVASAAPEVSASPRPDGPVLPDFAAFCNNCVYEYSVRENTDNSEYVYFWNYNGKAQQEYISLLSAYGFTPRGTTLSDDSDTYSFDYTGSGTVRVFDTDSRHGLDDDECTDIVLFIWSCHFGSTGGEIHFIFSDSLTFYDAGDRTTREIKPYEDADTSSSSSSSSLSSSGSSDWNYTGVLDCLTCRGSGDCTKCNGYGYVYYAGVRQSCTKCHQSGNCSACGGSGKR